VIGHECKIIVDGVIVAVPPAEPPDQLVPRTHAGALLELEVIGVDVERQAGGRALAIDAIEVDLAARGHAIARVFPAA
jgi:hypothetical protein